MLNFEENEDVLFKHKSLFKNEEGDIIVTNIRLLFLHMNNDKTGNNIILSWSNITDIKYSPANDPKGRAIILLKTAINNSQEDNIAIHLVNSSIEKKFAELERLKTITSQIRKKKLTTISNKKENNKQILSNHNNNDKHKIDNNADMIKRQKILESDKQLSKQYKELVIVSKVITEDDFWQTHEEIIQNISHSDNYINHNKNTSSNSNDGYQKKGKQNVLNLLDIIETSPDGEITSIDLSIDMKRDLFIMHPWLKRAFESEVPLRKDETQFWTDYFQSEYYKLTSANAKNQNKFNSSSSSIFNNSNGNRHDQHYSNELLLRYGDEDDKKFSHSHVSSSLSSSSVIPFIQSNMHKKLHQLAHTDIDLTSSYGDYRSKGENLDGEDESTASSNMNNNHNNPLIHKYNQTSMNVIKSDHQHVHKRSNSGDKKHKDIFIGIDDSYTLKELENSLVPSFIELKYHSNELNHTRLSSDDVASASVDKATTPNICNLPISMENTPRLQTISSLISTQDIDSNKNKIPDFVPSMISLEEQQHRYFHMNSTRGDQLFTLLTNKLRKQQSTAHKQNLPYNNNIINNNNNITNTSIKNTRSYLLDETFKQELLELYTDVTELLRHFYVTLNRCTSSNASINPNKPSTSISNNANISKAEAILERLKEYLENNLENKKFQINEKRKTYLSKQYSTTSTKEVDMDTTTACIKSLDASLSAINSIMVIIRRAQITWNEFQQL